MQNVFILWNDDMQPRDAHAVVGVFLSHMEAERGWLRYCASGQWRRDVGSHRVAGAHSPHTIETRTLGHVQTVADPGDDGSFG